LFDLLCSTRKKRGGKERRESSLATEDANISATNTIGHNSDPLLPLRGRKGKRRKRGGGGRG